MNQELINHFPAWYADLADHPEHYYLVLSDDMDSLASCRFLYKKFGLEIGGFYQFESGLWQTDEVINGDKKPVFVDCAVCRDGIMAIDNHRSILPNHMAINPNMINQRFKSSEYANKYNGSTLMLLYALYGNPSELTDVQKDVLCAIDGFYIGFYRGGGKYKDVNLFWLNQLGLIGALLPTLEEHDAEYFVDLTAEMQLKEKIYINDGKLFTYKDVLPHDNFNLTMQVEKEVIKKDELMDMSLADIRKLFICAETYRDNYIINRIITNGK